MDLHLGAHHSQLCRHSHLWIHASTVRIVVLVQNVVLFMGLTSLFSHLLSLVTNLGSRLNLLECHSWVIIEPLVVRLGIGIVLYRQVLIVYALVVLIFSLGRIIVDALFMVRISFFAWLVNDIGLPTTVYFLCGWEFLRGCLTHQHGYFFRNFVVNWSNLGLLDFLLDFHVVRFNLSGDFPQYYLKLTI